MATYLRDLVPDRLADASVASSNPAPSIPARPPRVVIVGAGFGGLSAAIALRRAKVHVTLIDRRNYHLFQPLLYQVATAALSPADIAQPIRSILRHQRNATVLLGRVTGVDKASREVLIDERRIPYDYLIVATGARHAYFGNDAWEPFAPGLKKIEDATGIRRRILLAFEEAETAAHAAHRAPMLSFVVVGGGPTGVELAGAIAELARVALAADFRHVDPRETRIVLVEAGPRLLSAFPDTLSAKAKRALERLGVEVRLSAAVSACDEDGVAVGGERIAARTVLWAAGVAASPAAKWLDAEKDRAGRVKVEADLSLPGHPEIFVIGDTALATDGTGNPLPGVAPAAKQAGRHVARVIRARVDGRRAPPPFRYRHLGNLATIGRSAAIADFGRLRLSGRVAWLLWGIVHIYFLIGFRNRLVVALDWVWAYLTFERGSRLITGPTP
ncbi:MAG TPA: NAD(P)/FAD-dependent oxidoreductase [Geminicoccaceae bacterium]|nr:NAD(P)/FAD-dependent oxidoreductase [Geminicoccaceae bacterium]